MAQCKDCIHYGLCKIYSDFIRNHDCELFVGKADVVPKSEVEKIFEEIEAVLNKIFEEYAVLGQADCCMITEIIRRKLSAELKKKYTESEDNI